MRPKNKQTKNRPNDDNLKKNLDYTHFKQVKYFPLSWEEFVILRISSGSSNPLIYVILTKPWVSF